jgi:hypothetical protein
LCLLLFSINISSANAQSFAFDTAKNKIADSSLKDFPIPALRDIAIGKSVKFTVGGQLREFYQNFHNEAWGDIPPAWVDKNGFYWHRIILSTDWQFGKRINLFGELNSALTSGRKGGNRPSVDYNELDLTQLYLQVTLFQNAKSNFKIKAGRQMYSFGSGRLISKREPLNNRLSFNGATAIYQNKNSTLISFIAQPNYNKLYVFDDSVVKSQTIWGTNLVHSQTGKPTKWELYYYGSSNSNIKFAGNFGKDIRHTIGFLVTTGMGKWTFETEPVLQFGKFNSNTAIAYSLSFTMKKKYLIKKTSITPGISLGVFSGDKKAADPILNTYNGLYSRQPFGLAAPLGPANIMGCNPEITIAPGDAWQFRLLSYIVWRNSRADGLYTPAASPAIQQIYPADAVNTRHSKFIGSHYVLAIDYKITNYLLIGFNGGYFIAGTYLKQAGKGKNITYLSGTIRLNF